MATKLIVGNCEDSTGHTPRYSRSTPYQYATTAPTKAHVTRAGKSAVVSREYRSGKALASGQETPRER